MICLLLFWEFFKIGLFTFGGGLAALPFLFDLSLRYGWFSQQELADMIAIAESTPGPLAINMATYAGYHTAGIPGSLVASLAMVLPPLMLSLLLCRLLRRYADTSWLERSFWGLRPAVAGLIAAVCCSLIDLALAADLESGLAGGADPLAVLLFILFLPAVFRLKKHPILFIATGAFCGMILQL